MNEEPTNQSPEMLVDLVDWRGIPKGGQMKLSEARAKGRGYRSFHIWILRETEDGRIEALLRRDPAHAGLFDVAVRGAVPAGEGWVRSALRQVESDLGIVATTDDLRFAGKTSYDTDILVDGNRVVTWDICAVYFLLYGWRDPELRRLPPALPGTSWTPLASIARKRGGTHLRRDVRRMEAAWLQEHPYVAAPGHRPPVARFAVTAGPAALFKRVRLVVRPETDYFDRAVHVRHLVPWDNIPTVDTVDAFLEDDQSTWNLVGAEVRTDTGKFIRSHWNIRYRGDWCRLVLDGRGDVYTLKRIATPLEPLRHAVTGGPVWDFVSRVNQALMDAALGFEYRSSAISNGKTIVP